VLICVVVAWKQQLNPAIAREQRKAGVAVAV
jgi:hypothetical protein